MKQRNYGPTKPVKLVNPITGDKYVCRDMRRIKYIDGDQYITVTQANGSPREFLMRKSALVKDK